MRFSKLQVDLFLIKILSKLKSGYWFSSIWEANKFWVIENSPNFRSLNTTGLDIIFRLFARLHPPILDPRLPGSRPLSGDSTVFHFTALDFAFTNTAERSLSCSLTILTLWKWQRAIVHNPVYSLFLTRHATVVATVEPKRHKRHMHWLNFIFGW